MKKLTLIVLYLTAILLPGTALAGAKRISVHIPFGSDNLIATNKPVSLRAQCVLNEGGTSRVRLYGVTTALTGTAMNGNDDYNGNGGNFLLPGASATSAELLSVEVTTGEVKFDTQIDNGFILATVEGKGLAVDGESAVLGIDASGCYLSVAVDKINKFKPLKLLPLPA